MREIKNYHYKECGLDNIWLKNGVEEADTGYGLGVSIPDIDELHQLIGLEIIKNPGVPDGAEIRFLRYELDLSQKILAGLLGVSEQSLARWEKNKCDISGPAKNLLFGLYRETVTGYADLAESLTELSELDADNYRMTLEIQRFDQRWEAA